MTIRGLLLVDNVSVAAGTGGLAAIPALGLDVVQEITTLGLG